MIKTLTYTVVACLLLASSCLASPDLAALCNNKPLELTRISQVVSLIDEAANSPPGECSRKLLDALTDLKPILTEDTGSVCSVHKANQIVAFHKRYISKSSWRLSGASLPGPLERFVLALGLKVGAACRQTMLSSLVEDSQKQLTSADFDSFKTNGGDLLTAVSSKLKDLDDILLLSDIVETGSREKVYIQTSFSSRAKSIQAACERRFKPFYGPLVLPFAILSTAGYSITGMDAKRELEELKSSEALSNWYDIALVCEAFAKMETFESSDPNSRKIRILKRDEADELRQTQQAQTEEIGRDQVSYKAATQGSVADLILDESDASLLEQVNEFRVRRKMLRRLRRKAMRRFVGQLKEALLSSHEVSLISSLFRSRKPDNNLDLIETVENELKHKDESSGALTRRKRNSGTKTGLAGLTFIILIICLFIVALILSVVHSG